MVRAELSRHAAGNPIRLRDLISCLVRESGHPRDACLRFARQMGITQKRNYRVWSDEDRQQLLTLLKCNSVAVIAAKLNRSRSAVYSQIRQIGRSGAAGEDGNTKYLLARLLRTRPDTVQNWIDAGLLPAHAEDGKPA